MVVRLLRWIARFLCSTVIFVVGIYTVMAGAVAFFIVTGRLTPGQVMIYDSNTPTLAQTLMFIGVGSLIVAGFAVLRHKLGRATGKAGE